MFLLMFVHQMDDCPVGLYSTAEEAVAAARSRNIEEGLTLREHSVLESDASTPLGFAVVEFDERGYPSNRTVVKWIDE